MSELLPCPFCGEHDPKFLLEHQQDGWPVIACDNCGASGPRIHSDKDRAKQDWNRRASVQDEWVNLKTENGMVKLRVGQQWYVRGNNSASWFATYREGHGLAERVTERDILNELLAAAPNKDKEG